MNAEQLQEMREAVWLRMHETQKAWDEDTAIWRRVWFAHLVAMFSWLMLTYMHRWGF